MLLAGKRRIAALAAGTLALGTAYGGVLASPASATVSGAAFTTVNTVADGDVGQCLNGNPAVNCNIYTDKSYVWLNGGPSTAYAGDGTYFFAVLSPGGQSDPNDGAADNLSDNVDVYRNRTFSITGGAVTYGGSHQIDDNKIRLAAYANTTSPGGVYILAICSLADGYPVTPSECKYDAFKVESPDSPPPGGVLDAPSAVKDASGVYNKTWTWDVAKSVTQSQYWQPSGNVTPAYTVTVTHDNGTVSGVQVTGTISVFNTNIDTDGNTIPITGVTVTDKLSDGTECLVTGGSSVELLTFETDFPYACSLNALPEGQLDNSVYLAYQAQNSEGSTLGASDGTEPVFTFSDVQFTPTNIDDSVNVTDAFNGADPDTLGTVHADDPSPYSFHPSRSIPVLNDQCIPYLNIAKTVTNTTQTTDESSANVTVCGGNSGGHTMGFWQNKNGQSVIDAAGPATGACNVTVFLRGYAPFQDLDGKATCAAVKTYVNKVIAAASAGGATMNAMLKAQLLATALAVYFNNGQNLGSSTYAKYGATTDLGSHLIDLTHIWGKDTSAAFNDFMPPAATCQTVSQLLTYAAARSNAGGSIWYAQVKSTQGLAKNTFDAINNGAAYPCQP